MDALPEVLAHEGLLDRGDYLSFLRRKFRFDTDAGFVVRRDEINAWMKPHAADLVEWMVRKGKAACFSSFGLHKTSIQIEAMRLIQARTKGRCLIVIPLGVRQEFFRDAASLGVTLTFIRRDDEVAGPGIYLTNYESVRDGKLNPALFDAASLDEASILRGYGTKTFQEFLRLFARVPYRFVATATPSPNEKKELIHYAGFLGIMDTGQALTRFFQRDSEKAGNLTLLPHMEREFWLWLHSWAAFVQKPSDLGHSDEGYILPRLDVRKHEVRADAVGGGVERDGQMRLIRDAALGLKEAAAEKRNTIDARVERAMEIVQAAIDEAEEAGGQAAARAEQVIVWVDLNDEQAAMERALAAAGITYSSIHGSLTLEEQETRLTEWRDRRTQVLIAKPVMLGAGVNMQQSREAVFLGVGYKFNDFIQAVHRIRRFGQTRQCRVHIILAETEREVWRSLQRKWQEHEELTARMAGLISAHGLSTLGLERELARTIGVDRREERGDRFAVAHNDTVLECDRMASNSVDLMVTSIPFGNHYEYSASFEDFGHNEDHARFFEQMGFLTPNLLRVLRPGRVLAVHVKDRIRFGNVTGLGMPTTEPFHADCIAHYRAAGFAYMGLIFVETDVVRENNQTYRLGYTEMCKDGSKMGVGSPEFILLFRKLPTDLSTAYADVPVVKAKDGYSLARWQIDAASKWRSSGDRLLTAEEWEGYGPDQLAKAFKEATRHRIYDFREHVALGEALQDRDRLPKTFAAIAAGSHRDDAWDDVVRMRTLNGKQAQKNLVQHICPLQLDIVERLIERYSNPGEVVFDPFGGLFTVPYCAIKLGRYGRAVELNPDYFRDGLTYLREIEREASAPSLFDAEGLRGAAEAA